MKSVFAATLFCILVSVGFAIPSTPVHLLRRAAVGSLGAWEFCTYSSECKVGCCSNQYSDDKKFKCTPGASVCTPKLGDWAFCIANSDCTNNCCSSQYSNDGLAKCTPGGSRCDAKNSLKSPSPSPTPPPPIVTDATRNRANGASCLLSVMCQSNCCSSETSTDGSMRCIASGSLCEGAEPAPYIDNPYDTGN